MPCGLLVFDTQAATPLDVKHALLNTIVGVVALAPDAVVDCLASPLEPDCCNTDMIAPVAASAEQSQVTVIEVAAVVVLEINAITILFVLLTDELTSVQPSDWLSVNVPVTVVSVAVTNASK